MSKENFEALKDRIEAIQLDDETIPHVPVSVFLQEASNLLEWSWQDRQKLIAVGVAEDLFEQLEIRIGALRYAQAAWIKARFSKKEAKREFEKELPKAQDLKNELEHDFRYAFRNRSDLLNKVKRVEEGNSHADLVQDLSDLSALGLGNLPLLQAINFEENKLHQASKEATDLSMLLAKVRTEKRARSQLKTSRDKAYIYLKQAVATIREAGKYIFWKDKARKRGYISSYNSR